MLQKVQKNSIESQSYSLIAIYPSGIPRRDPPSCEAPREPTMYVLVFSTEGGCTSITCLIEG